MEDDALPRKKLKSRTDSAQSSMGGTKKKKAEKREHRKSAPMTTLIEEKKKKKGASCPRITIPSVEMKLLMVPPPLSANSGSSSSPTTPGHVYTPHTNGRDLYNRLRDEIDVDRVPFCFQCGRPRTECGGLLLTKERTGFKLHEGREVDIYRPLFSCEACLENVILKRTEDPAYRVRLYPGAHVFYETSK